MKNFTKQLSAIMMASVILLSGCSKTSGKRDEERDLPVNPDDFTTSIDYEDLEHCSYDENSLAEDYNAYSFELMSQVLANESAGTNVMVSPASIMWHQVLQPALFLMTSKTAGHQSNDSEGVLFSCANAVWANQNYLSTGLNPDYEEYIQEYFDAEINEEPFGTSTVNEINDWGMYQGGYVNSQFAQKGVVQATDGYTYITNDDDVYLYTGITSIASDESNIGFVMVNLRTHKASYYAVPGAEEYGAMDSANGQVQEKNYTPTFPLLINLEGRPTYLLSLKDAGGLVKMYAFVDVENYQKVSVTDASFGIKYAADEYIKMINGGVSPTPKPDDPEPDVETKTAIIIVKSITKDTGVIYVVSSYDEKFKIEFSVDESIVPFIKEGDTYEITYYNSGSSLNVVTKIRELTPTVPDNPGTDTENQQQSEQTEEQNDSGSWENVSNNEGNSEENQG